MGEGNPTLSASSTFSHQLETHSRRTNIGDEDGFARPMPREHLAKVSGMIGAERASLCISLLKAARKAAI
jgi:hypothetical protein